MVPVMTFNDSYHHGPQECEQYYCSQCRLSMLSVYWTLLFRLSSKIMRAYREERKIFSYIAAYLLRRLTGTALLNVRHFVFECLRFSFKTQAYLK